MGTDRGTSSERLSSSVRGRGRRLAYLCLETPREGQAVRTHVNEICAGLSRIGWQTQLFATAEGGASSGRSYLRRLVDYAKVQFALLRQLGRFDAVFCRAHFMAVPTAFLARLRGVPVFQELNGTPADIGVTYPWVRPFMPVIAWLFRIQLRSAAHVFVVTDGLREWAETSSRHRRVSTVSNGANTELFTPDGPTGTVPGRYVIFVGGLVGWHGIDAMLRAAEDPLWPKDVSLVIVGDGVERHRLEGLPPESNVRWLGRRPYEEIPRLLRGAFAALCVTENPDGRSSTGVAPLKLFEAMACGVPVIASNLPSQREIVQRADAGYIIEPQDPRALAATVAEVAREPEEAKRRGRNGAAYVATHASWDARAIDISRWMDTYIDAAP